MCASRFTGISRGLSLLAAAAAFSAMLPAAGQQLTVQASIDRSCATREAILAVPAGQTARNFTFTELNAGFACTTRAIIGDKAWGISDNPRRPRAGNVYYYNHNANGSIYEEPVPLKALVLQPGRYSVHVDGGIDANVRVTYVLGPAGGAAVPGAVGGAGAAGGNVPPQPGLGGWEYVGIGDCPGNDIAGGGEGSVPNPAACDAAHNGNAAVCWDAHTPRVMTNPGCTIKSVKAENCKGGVNPGRMYRCNFRGAAAQPTPTTGSSERVFVDPKMNGRDIDNCVTWATNCQKPAADYFCRQNGYAEAASFTLVKRRPTLVMGDGRICDEDGCGGFSRIVCASRASAPAVTNPPPANPPAAGGATRVGPMEANTDMMGYDIRSLDLQSANPSACQAECLRTPDCRAWTYVKPNTKQGPRPRCWLKNPVPARNPDPCCTSGEIERR